MPSASTSNAVYDNDAVERDLIDPDDGMLAAAYGICTMHCNTKLTSCSDPRRPRRPTAGDLGPRSAYWENCARWCQYAVVFDIKHPWRRPPCAHQHHRRDSMGDTVARPARHLGEDEAGVIP